MKYPKPVMTTSELVKMGFSASLLRKMLREPGQKFAFRYNPPNGNIYWDTEKLQKRIEKCAVR